MQLAGRLVAILASTGYVSANNGPSSSQKIAANGGVVFKTSEECTAAIQKYCMKVTDEQINECRRKHTGYDAKV